MRQTRERSRTASLIYVYIVIDLVKNSPIVWAHKDDADKERMNAEVKERIENIAHAVEGELQGQLHTVFEDIEGDLTDIVAQMKTMQAELRSELGIRDLSVDGAEFVRTKENAAALEKLAVATNMLNVAETFLTSSVGKGVAEAAAATAAVWTELGQIAGELDALKGELTVYS